ncbi:hypothetical protein [Deinococcus aerophilus]|uniref:Transcriptional regulator n=1 Tax=Deinococcus aerophilus TaxID=522488 RepID=A0ABQ2GSF2_9DEIO|nr:hypothetical protein [Deinococcus aerophilus]GGM09834.1 hypothetical protein GCM10010841_17820 [Deinococcus aerophilus]
MKLALRELTLRTGTVSLCLAFGEKGLHITTHHPVRGGGGLVLSREQLRELRTWLDEVEESEPAAETELIAAS